MKRISKKDVQFVLNDLIERSASAKSAFADLSLEDSDINYGKYIGLQEAINVVKLLLL